MLFLWSREPVPNSRAGPWLAWATTAIVLWRCRRRIASTILSISPLKVLKRRCVAPVINPEIIPLSKNSTTRKPTSNPQEKLSLILSTKHNTGIKTRVKRLCTGDGPHVTSASCLQTTQQVNYRVTRSGRVYGKYPHKIVVPKKQ